MGVGTEALSLLLDNVHYTTGDLTKCVLYTWGRSCVFYEWRNAACRLSLPDSLYRQRRASFMATAISRSHSCQLLHRGRPGSDDLFEKSWTRGRIFASDWSGCDNLATHDWNVL